LVLQEGVAEVFESWFEDLLQGAAVFQRKPHENLLTGSWLVFDIGDRALGLWSKLLWILHPNDWFWEESGRVVGKSFVTKSGDKWNSLERYCRLNQLGDWTVYLNVLRELKLACAGLKYERSGF